ncbi:MAG: XdhC family protein, partial [Acidimicrobiales bacterium]
MRDVLDAIEGWRAEGHRVALATVTKVKGSAPRPPGAKMAVSDDGRWVGSVSGGCVEGAVYELAQEVLETGTPVRHRFGYSDETAFSVGLTCGGTVEVFVEAVVPGRAGAIDQVLAALKAEEPAALAMVVTGPADLL